MRMLKGVWDMFLLRQIKLTVTKYSFLHVYELTTSLLLTKKSLFVVSKNCLGKQAINLEGSRDFIKQCNFEEWMLYVLKVY